MRTASPRATVIACAALVAGAALALFGFGPLDPPDGPISPTYKTLSEVEPRTAINAANTPGDADSKFKISKPGSYYLTGNLTGVSGKSGIEVTANCTIDLCGFQLTGVNGSLDGILLVGEFHGTVRNGQIAGWGGDGIDGGACRSCHFDDLSIESCAGTGITIGRDSVLTGVLATSNQANGIVADGYCTIADCVASGNGNWGIDSGSFSTVSRCNARGNVGAGILSFAGLNASDCVSVANGNYGIAAGGGVVRGNVCDGNPTANIVIDNAGGTIVTGNTCSNTPAAYGIYCYSGFNHVEGNLCKSDKYGVAVLSNGHNLVVRNGFADSGYAWAGGNNIGELIFNPDVDFTWDNSWGNVSAK